MKPEVWVFLGLFVSGIFGVVTAVIAKTTDKVNYIEQLNAQIDRVKGRDDEIADLKEEIRILKNIVEELQRKIKHKEDSDNEL
ncbi:hypothetical protein [Lactobacillus terrae]|uniref:hypothetical protein n=1 Tax=Lactobacillus terrae TaxID=2269374 RepID=UPI000C1B6A80|nr:hypothetical protein [Lactobacillus terrae]